MARITKRIVDAQRPSDKPVYTWDDELKGFGLQVLPSGTKSFVFQYRTAENVSRRATLGKFGALTPDQAREIAKDYAARVRAGGDPQEEKVKARLAVTVSQLVDGYLASPRFAEKAATTQSSDKGRINGHLKPLLGSRHCHKLTADDIRRAFNAIRDGKTAKKAVKVGHRAVSHLRGGEGTARHSVRLLSAMFTWGIEEKLVTENPCLGVKTGSDGEREIVLEPEHYERLFATLDTMEAEGRIRAVAADLFRMYAITGARRSEMLRLCWRSVDLKAGRIVLVHHKTAKKTGRTKIITLPAVAQQIIARQPEGEPDDLVFQPSKGEGHLVPEKDWRKVRVEANLPNYTDGKPIGFHGLRHAVGSWLAMGGAQDSQIMSVLGHKQSSTVRRYIHFADQAKAALAERAAGPALAGMAAAAGRPKATVTPLKKR